VEDAGDQRNSRLAREVLMILPPELKPAQSTDLVRTLSQELAKKYRSAVDFAVHEPRAGSDHRHHHAHVLMDNSRGHTGGFRAKNDSRFVDHGAAPPFYLRCDVGYPEVLGEGGLGSDIIDAKRRRLRSQG
jgi:hypothetical protein